MLEIQYWDRTWGNHIFKVESGSPFDKIKLFASKEDLVL